jgi:hypothetical protein
MEQLVPDGIKVVSKIYTKIEVDQTIITIPLELLPQSSFIFFYKRNTVLEIPPYFGNNPKTETKYYDTSK